MISELWLLIERIHIRKGKKRGKKRKAKVIIVIFLTFEFNDFTLICVLVAHSVEFFLKKKLLEYS